jgi:hypothetical protein
MLLCCSLPLLLLLVVDGCHLQCLCGGCAQLYDYVTKGCPMCRQPVQQTLKVHG